MLDMNRYISVILHEIRSPLNAILGIVEIAKNRGTENEFLNQIKTIAQYMLALSDNVLDNIKETHNSACGTKENFRLRDLAEEVVNIFDSQKQIKNIDFHFEIDDGGSVLLCGDTLKLKQILINILANAFKFTNADGRIEFLVNTVAKEEKLNAEFIIRDNGIGMCPEFLDKIFLPFTQGAENNKNGSGLGLMIVHQLVQQMGGNIDVKSEKGKGSEFVVNLDFEYGEKQKQQKNDFHMKRILLVDDSLLNLEVVSLILKETGAEIDVASNGKIAFDKFVDSEENYYDLILMDMRMPVLSGCEVTKAIRTLERNDAQEIKIIGFSSNSLKEDVYEALACGMNDYISKPIAADKLYEMLAKYL